MFEFIKNLIQPTKAVRLGNWNLTFTPTANDVLTGTLTHTTTETTFIVSALTEDELKDKALAMAQLIALEHARQTSRSIDMSFYD